MKKFIAFTLAEVLITISILGVIAALTIPNLYQQRKRKEFSAKLAHFYSKFENAIEQSSIETSLKHSKCPVYRAATSSDAGLRTDAMLDWYLEYIDPYMGHVSIKTVDGPYRFRIGHKDNQTNNPNSPKHHKIYFEDGSMFIIYSTGCNCPQWLYDITADAGPNTAGVDIHLFTFCFTDALRKSYFGNPNVYFAPYNTGSSVYGEGSNNAYVGANRQVLLKWCSDKSPACEQNPDRCNENPNACTRLIQLDGWEFKPDFPIRL